MTKPNQSKKQTGFLTQIANSLGNFCLIVGIILLIYGFFTLFSNFATGFFVMIIGAVIGNIYNMTPKGKKEMQIIEQKKQEEALAKVSKVAEPVELGFLKVTFLNEEESKLKKLKEEDNRNNLSNKFKSLSVNFDLEILTQSIPTIAILDTEQRAEVAKFLLELLKQHGLVDDIRNLLFKGLQQIAVIPSICPPNHVSTEQVYKTALALLEENPKNMSLRAFALEVGRWQIAPAKFLKGLVGVHSASDEQAIINDILIRTQ